MRSGVPNNSLRNDIKLVFLQYEGEFRRHYGPNLARRGNHPTYPQENMDRENGINRNDDMVYVEDMQGAEEYGEQSHISYSLDIGAFDDEVIMRALAALG